MPEVAPGITNPPSTQGRVWDSGLIPTPEDIRKFNSKVVRSPSCWFWTGAISTPDGYGRFSIQSKNRQRTILAHRFALLVSGIRLWPDTVGEHFCNEPLCVRVDPKHLHISTQQQNLAYAVKQGRQRGNVTTVQSHRRAQRSLRIRKALEHGWDEEKFNAAISKAPPSQMSLF